MSDVRIDPRGVRLMVVEADLARRQQLVRTLAEAGYDATTELTDVRACAALARGNPPDLVLIDLDDAEQVARALVEVVTAFPAPSTPPLFGLTSDVSADGRRRAAAIGVADYAFRPVDAAELRLRVGNSLTSGRLRRLLSDRSAKLTEALRERTAELDTVRESLSTLAAMADYHDDDTDQHAERVGIVAAAVARELGLGDASVSMLRAAAPLHDIGKVGISRRILLKPGKLTAQEWMHMQRHVEIGAQILASAQSPVLVLAAEIARTHHERFDGSGYVAGMTGEQIPLPGRIVAVADVWDTLTHDRPYRPAWTPERAMHEIHEQSGRHFDPQVVEAFSSLETPALALPAGAERVA